MRLCRVSQSLVGYAPSIVRKDPSRRVQQAALIAQLLGCHVTLREEGPGIRVSAADGLCHSLSGAYAGGDWHFALSRQKVGLDVMDLSTVPNTLSDLCPLLDPKLPSPESPKTKTEAPPPFLLHFCAAEAVGKLLHVGLTRDILRSSFLRLEDETWTLRNTIEILNYSLQILDISLFLRQKLRIARRIGVLAFFSI